MAKRRLLLAGPPPTLIIHKINGFLPMSGPFNRTMDFVVSGIATFSWANVDGVLSGINNFSHNSRTTNGRLGTLTWTANTISAGDYLLTIHDNGSAEASIIVTFM